MRSLLPALIFLFALVVGPGPAGTGFHAQVSAQDLVPVNSRRAVTWSNAGRNAITPANSGELPAPVTPMQELIDTPEPDPPDFFNSSREEADLRMMESAGRVEVVRQRYPDGKVQIERQVTQDEAGNFLNHGEWKLLDQRGQVMAQGTFRKGHMHGSWQRLHAAGSPGLFAEAPFNQFRAPFRSVTTFKLGKQDGMWTISDQYQRKVLEIPYANGRRNGRAIWYRPNSMVMREVNFRNGQLHGELVEYDQRNQPARRAVYEGGQELITRTSHYHKDQKQAEFSFLGPKLVFSGQDDWWNADPVGYDTVGEELQHGPAQEWYSNGQLKMRGQFRQGQRHGPFYWWHENGQRQIAGAFVDGARTGRWTWWHANGIKAIEGNYTVDNAAGVWTWWDEQGKVEKQEDMSDPWEGLEDLNSLEDSPDPFDQFEELNSLPVPSSLKALEIESGDSGS
ncbi:MAG: toxin-antitoxin system YwqK family antitoxin [Pirellulaceae bacterium]